MFKKSIVVACLSSLSMFLFCFNSSGTNDGSDEEKVVIKKVRNTLSQMHYSSKPIDDKFSKEVFKRYLDFIDPYKRFFTDSDYQEFKKHELLLDDYFNTENLEFYKLTVERLYQRIDESEKIVNQLLEKPIDFTKDDYLITDEKLRTYPKSEEEIKKEWLKFIKYQVFREIETKVAESKLDKKHKVVNQKIDIEENKISDLVADESNFLKHKDSAIIETKEYMKEYFRRTKARKKKDFLSFYINAHTESFDPHTSYMSPKEQDQFNASISGKIIGVGAKLQDKKGYPTFSELIIGGPAWKSKEIDVGDKILKVGQGNEEPVNVVGMLLDDSIQLIRGKEDTQVVLVIQKKDGTIKSVKMTREEIELEESFVKSAILQDEKNQKYGFIYLPEFYIDIENPEKGRNCASDMKKEILELKKENIKGLIIDLRGNGGGSLPKVVEIAGEFITQGPVVQVKSSDGYEKIHKDTNPGINWEGSLVVLVDEMSASASEILAAALQDYKRAVIIGSTQTYGKGTVQSVIPLDRFSLTPDKYGILKLTIQKFYRVNGSSTQIKGVVPDIILKSPYQYAEISEASQENALAWDQVEKLDYQLWNKPINYDYIKKKSQERLIKENFLNKIEEKAKWIQSISKEKQIPLNYKKYIEDSKLKVEKAKKYDKDLEYNSKFSVKQPQYENAIYKKDSVFRIKRQKWHKELKKDFYLNEALNVLKDIK